MFCSDQPLSTCPSRPQASSFLPAHHLDAGILALPTSVPDSREILEINIVKIAPSYNYLSKIKQPGNDRNFNQIIQDTRCS